MPSGSSQHGQKEREGGKVEERERDRHRESAFLRKKKNNIKMFILCSGKFRTWIKAVTDMCFGILPGGHMKH